MQPDVALARVALPSLDVRAALDLVATQTVRDDGVLAATVVGRPELVAELGRYAVPQPDPATVVALGLEPSSLRSTVTAARPERVVGMVDGRLAVPDRLPRPGTPTLGPDLSRAAWRDLGYRAVAARGVQGPGFIAWAVVERLVRRLGRPALADRARIGTLRSLVVSSLLRPLARVDVREYRKVA